MTDVARVPEIDGHCDAAFGEVRRAFAENFGRGEVGAACSVVIDGRTVVDLWGGWADEDRKRTWRGDTLVNAYSVGKPIVALSVLQLVASGVVQLDEPASRWWPELVAGQQGATVRDLLCHRAGVPSIRRRLTNDALWDWDVMAGAVAETQPWWTPGTKHAYHVNTYGYLAGELSRRVTGDLPGRWLQDKVAGPLGADLAWGLTSAQRTRCADVVWEPNVNAYEWPDTTGLPDEQRMLVLGYTNPPGFSSLGVVNTDEWRTTQVPSTNLHATARGIARVYSALSMGGSIDGVTVLDTDVLHEATKPQSDGWCPFLERDVTFGLGFQPTRPDRPFGPNAGSFGHFGTGGAVGFADPSASLAFGYAMNAVRPRWQNPRNRALVDAVYSCL
jgi:CubicO group peptidase (beta-lactamase class C family)